MKKKSNRGFFFSLYRHGDIIYVSYVEPEIQNSVDIPDETQVKQDEVDDFLEKQRGLIDRKKDLKL